MGGSPSSTGGALRLGFAGTPEFAASILTSLIEARRQPVIVYTQPDRPGRRGRRPLPPPVKTLALAHGLAIRQPPNLVGEATALAELGLDVLVVAAYGLLLPQTVLERPAPGCINVHASLLPRWRGAAPVERAIMAGDRETGVSIMRMDEGLDTGPVYLTRRCTIMPDTDGPGLEAELARLGSEALLDCLDRLDSLSPTPQPEGGITYARKLTRNDAILRWEAPAAVLERQVRALRGRLPAFTRAGDVRVSVLAARTEPAPFQAAPGTILAIGTGGIIVACGEGALVILSLRLDVGQGRPLTAGDAVNGYPDVFAPGQQLTAPASPSPRS